MNQHDALLAAVCAASDDDLPRLVYADWCDENGESTRAELIRVQCAFDRHPERDAVLTEYADGIHRPTSDISPERRHAVELHLRSLRLMPRCPFWNQCEDLTWVRGFIDRVVCQSHVWLGGRCEVCVGVGTVQDAVGKPDVRRDCMQCGGRGQFDPGIGPAVTRGHPVRTVAMEDAIRRPIQFVGTSFAFLQGNTIHSADIGPAATFLSAPTTLANGIFQFASFEEAINALSKAAIAWAKSVQG